MKKVAKKARKKIVRTVKKAALKVMPKPHKSEPAGKPIGVVTHYFAQIKVAIIKFKQPVKVGSSILIQGTTTDFTHKISSMQFDHKPISVAKKGQEVGIKVAKRVREGDKVYPV